MTKKKPTYKYLLLLYSRVNDFLNNANPAQEEISDNIVSFCTAIEKILKIKLYKKNPFLVFDTAHVRDENSLSIIALKNEKEIETAKIKEILNRFAILFKKVFTSSELQALRDIYELRNSFVHGYKSDDKISFNPDDVLKKMGTIWEKISPIAVILLGEDNITNSKPKKKYSEEELEEVLEDEVRKMIKQSSNRFAKREYYTNSVDPFTVGNCCPRCGARNFSLGDSGHNPWSISVRDASSSIYGIPNFDGEANLYKCKSCNLELTEKQYEIAKRIRPSASAFVPIKPS